MTLIENGEKRLKQMKKKVKREKEETDRIEKKKNWRGVKTVMKGLCRLMQKKKVEEEI